MTTRRKVRGFEDNEGVGVGVTKEVDVGEDSKVEYEFDTKKHRL